MSDIRYYTDGEQATASVLNRPLQDLEKQSQYMSEAQFESLRENRKNQFAGSGFIEWGNANPYAGDQINKGMFVTQSNDVSYKNYKKLLMIGAKNGASYIDNGHKEAVAVVAGNRVVMNDGYSNAFNSKIAIEFPEAPSLAGIETSESASKDYKIGDMITFSKKTEIDITGDTLDGWNIVSGDFSIDNGKIYTNNIGNTDGILSVLERPITLIKGARYRFKGKVSIGTGNWLQLIVSGTYIQCQNGTHNIRCKDGDGSFDYEFTASESTEAKITFKVRYDTTEGWFENLLIERIDDSFLLLTKDVSSGENLSGNIYYSSLMAKYDIVFLETWYEKINEKGIVYPYGNIQYRGSNTDGLSGITEGTFSGAETYSLFGNWQENGSLIGRGYTWSTLSENDKLKFASNPNNNIFMKNDNTIVQFRYRIRVLPTPGDSNANRIDLFSSSTYGLPHGSGFRANVKGAFTLMADHYDFPNGLSTSRNKYLSNKTGYNEYPDKQEGEYGSDNYNSFYRERAIPIARISRRNKGAYDPINNPQGTALFSDGKKWYETEVSRNNIIDCFNNAINGDVESGLSGRPDGLLYDSINNKDIQDLRISAEKIVDKEGFLREKSFEVMQNKFRGVEVINNNDIITGFVTGGSGGSGGQGYFYFGNTLNNFSESWANNGQAWIYLVNQDKFYWCTIGGSFGTGAEDGFFYVDTSRKNCLDTLSHANPRPDITIDIGEPIIIGRSTNVTSVNNIDSNKGLIESDIVLISDIIGDPKYYPQEWKDKGIFGNPLILSDTDEDYTGSPYIKNTTYTFSSDSIKLSRQAINAKEAIAINKTTGEKKKINLQYEPWSGASGNYVNQLSDSNNDLYTGDGTINAAIETKTNKLFITYNDTFNPNDWIIYISYEAKANRIGNRYSQREVEAVGQGRIGLWYQAKYGSGISTDILKIIPTGDGQTSHYPSNIGEDFNVETSYFMSDKRLSGYAWGKRPSHKPIEATAITENVAKYFPTLVNVGGRAIIQYIYKEIIFVDGTHGDNAEFETGTIGVMDDENANKVRYGTANVMLNNIL